MKRTKCRIGRAGQLRIIMFASVLIAYAGTHAQFVETGIDRVKTPLAINLKRIGTIKPRTTKQIESSRLTVGCETLDRDLAIFDEYKAYLPILGMKKIRLQAGWGKCEKVKGVYDWKWLDDIINYAVANGIEPWLEASYGNPIYEGGGGLHLLNSLMTSEEAYQAWDRWVEALVMRYKDRVKEWEVWNEPDHPGQKISPETTALLNIRTANIIKRIQPDAEIAGLAFASHSNTEYLDRFLKVIADSNKLDMFKWISYHSYNMRPEGSYKGVASLRNVIDKYSKTLLLRQGENGAPSTYIPSFALDKYYWTEYTQAKYDMRRLLGDLGRDIETSVFTIIDINYGGQNRVLNTKGLIQSDTSKIAIRPKVAYYAVQNVAAIFDNTLKLNAEFSATPSAKQSMSIFAYKKDNSKADIITLWLDDKIPTNIFKTTPTQITMRGVSFTSPVLVDMMTGNIYELTKQHWSKKGDEYVFTDIPLYDSPMLIAERSVVLNKRK